MKAFMRSAIVLALLLASSGASPVLAQRPNIAAAIDESRGDALNNRALKGMVDATGIEPVTPTMST
jgi:hypothetical protein